MKCAVIVSFHPSRFNFTSHLILTQVDLLSLNDHRYASHSTTMIDLNDVTVDLFGFDICVFSDEILCIYLNCIYALYFFVE